MLVIWSVSYGVVPGALRWGGYHLSAVHGYAGPSLWTTGERRAGENPVGVKEGLLGTV